MMMTMMMMMEKMSSRKVSEGFGLIVFQIHNSNSFLVDGFLVSAGNLITTLPTWGPEFELSFELYFNSFSTTEQAQILHLKPKYNYCGAGDYCDRTLVIFELHGKVYVYMYFGLVFSYDVSLKNWTKIEVSLLKKLASDKKVKIYSFFSCEESSSRLYNVWCLCVIIKVQTYLSPLKC